MYDELLKALTEFVNAQTNSNNGGFSAADWVAIAVSVIALIGVAVSTWSTNRTARKTNREAINANIISAARIEWIQKVRVTSADFISCCNTTSVNDIDMGISDKNRNDLEKFERTAQKLCLYFGSDKKYDNNIDLLDTSSNDGKNSNIVVLIKQISLLFYARRGFAYDYLNHEEDDFYQMQMQKLEEGDEDYMKRAKAISDKTSYFCDVMRIYLKIEWERAKQNK